MLRYNVGLINSESMKKTAWMLILLLFALGGCSTDKKKMQMEDTLRLYGESIRWGQYAEAQTVQKDLNHFVDPECLKEIKVISYDVIRQEVHGDFDRVDQTVEIGFYHEQQGMVKKIIDRQSWVYDSEQGIWQLEGTLPDFSSAIQ